MNQFKSPAPWLEALLVCSLLTGCSSSSASQSENTSQTGSDSTDTAAENTSSDADSSQSSQTTENADTSKGNLGDYYVEIQTARLDQDYDGNNALVVTYSFTNNSEDTTSFMVALSDQAFQDGVQLDSAYVTSADSSASIKNVKTGGSLTVEQAYALTSDSDVEIEVSELFSFDDTTLTKTFILEDLQ